MISLIALSLASQILLGQMYGSETQSKINSNDWRFSGRLWTGGLYLMDDFDTQSVIEVYQNLSCGNPGTLLKVVYGKEKAAIATECATRCCVQRVLRGDETIAERIISNPSGTGPVVSNENAIGPSLIANIGINGDATSRKMAFKVNGEFASSLLNERSLLGHDRYRYKFTDVYFQYKDANRKTGYQIRIGRQSPVAGVLTDGASATFFLGDDGFKESKSLSFFGGLAPNPISKKPKLNQMTFGSYGTFIPNFSRQSDSKLRVESGLVGELYKKKFNRFYLFNRTHFTPIKPVSLMAMMTLDLPATGDDKEVGLNYATLQAYWRPNNRWFVSGGFTQFKIDRYLREESVRWITDEGSKQSIRIGDSLDRSHRYRSDARVSYKAFTFLQPYLKLRHERRSFDNKKTGLNTAGSSPAPQNLSLINKKNSYRLDPGFRVYPIASIETDTSFGFNQRYQSKAYEVFQNVNWSSSKKWAADAYGQVMWSKRLILNSVSTAPAVNVKSTDYYLGTGVSYKFLTDLLGQIRYDFSCEEDDSLGRNIFTHAVWARLDYRF